MNPAQRLAELDAILTEELLEKGLLGELPEAYRLIPLPLDEPEVAQKALLWAHEAPNPEGWPLVYALFLGGRPLRLLLPEREVPLGVSQAAQPQAKSGQRRSVRITHDKEADALHIAFGEGPAIVEEVAEGIALDWDSEGRLLGIEILDASKRLADPEALRRFALEALPLLG